MLIPFAGTSMVQSRDNDELAGATSHVGLIVDL